MWAWCVESNSESTNKRPEGLDSDDELRLATKKRPDDGRGTINTKSSRTKGKGKANRRKPTKTIFEVIPSEIMYEVFSLLEPQDLLSLTQVNKSVRGALMTKSSAWVWRTARLNLPDTLRPPECPVDQSEPQWAKLLFDTSCTVCGLHTTRHPSWALRMRLCPQCQEENLIQYGKAMVEFEHVADIKGILLMLPRAEDPQMVRTEGGMANGALYIIESILRMVEKCHPFQSESKLLAFRSQKMAEASEIMKSHIPLKTWYANRRPVEDGLCQKRIKARRNALRRKFMELGYKDWDINMVIRGVSSPDPLTENDWLRVRPMLEPMVKKNSSVRLQQERQCYIQRRARKFHDHYTDLLFEPRYKLPFLFFVPCCNTLLQMRPAIMDIILAEGGACIEEALGDIIPGAVEEWRADRKQEILSLLPDTGVFSRDATSPTARERGPKARFEALKLARCVFYCKTTMPSRDEYQAEATIFFGRSLSEHTCKTMWDPQTCYCNTTSPSPEYSCLRFSSRASEAVDAICQAVELNPDTATVSSLDRLDARFECIDCPEPKPKVRSWRLAIAHKHPKGGDPEFRRLDPKLEHIIKTIEMVSDPQSRVICALCGRRYSSTNIRGHLKTAHGEDGLTPSNHKFDPVRPPLPILKSELESARHCGRR